MITQSYWSRGFAKNTHSILSITKPKYALSQGRHLLRVYRSERPLPRGYTWPNPDIPVAFMDCADGHEFRAEGQSLYNDREIEAVVTTVSQLLKVVDMKSVGC